MGVTYLDNIVPVQHEVCISLVPPQVSCIRDQEAEVGLQELVAVVGLWPRPCPPPAAQAAPCAYRSNPASAPLLRSQCLL